jgi:DNA-binding protein H-NS
VFCLRATSWPNVGPVSSPETRAKYHERVAAGVVLVLEKLGDIDLCAPSIVGETADGRTSRAARDLASLSVDELWTLRETVDAILTDKISAELNELSRLLDRLSPREKTAKFPKRSKAVARQHPSSHPALPKYQNPVRPLEIWSGRGRRPLWLKEKLVTGRLLEDFRVPEHQGPASSV